MGDSIIRCNCGGQRLRSSSNDRHCHVVINYNAASHSFGVALHSESGGLLLFISKVSYSYLLRSLFGIVITHIRCGELCVSECLLIPRKWCNYVNASSSHPMSLTGGGDGAPWGLLRPGTAH